jgi:hypothetical protein
VTFEEAWRSRAVVDWSGRKVGILGIDALLANKRTSGRPKDLADVHELTRKPRRRT